MDKWYIEGFFFQSQNSIGRIPLKIFPFRVGRKEGLGLTLSTHSVSRLHAEFDLINGAIVLRDKRSTNGTFVNRKRIDGEMDLDHGDVIHFADFGVRLIRESALVSEESTAFGRKKLSDNLPEGIKELQELLALGAVFPVFQPIIATDTEEVHAYELLGRGKHPSIAQNPSPLFRIAESCNKAIELSVLFRETGFRKAATFPVGKKYFVNIHPFELADPSKLLESMERMRHEYSDISIVLEMHEQAVTNISAMKNLKDKLQNLEIGIAYDDFGAGQSRLMELVEAPPDYLKFDIILVREIDKASQKHKEMIHMLIKLAHKMKIKTLAECLERKEEVNACKKLGFDFIQGFYYGQPSLEPKYSKPKPSTK